MLSSLVSAIVGFFSAYSIIYFRENLSKWTINWPSQSALSIPNLQSMTTGNDDIMDSVIDIPPPIPMSIIKYQYHHLTRKGSISSISELMTGNWLIIIHRSDAILQKKKKNIIDTSNLETFFLSLDKPWNVMIVTNNDHGFVDIGSLFRIKYYPSIYIVRNGSYKQLPNTIMNDIKDITRRLLSIDREEEEEMDGWMAMEKKVRWMFKWQLYILKHYLKFLVILIK